MSDEKGKFSAEISQKVIDEALKSVQRHTHAPDAEVPVEVEAPAEAAAPAAPEAPADPKDAQLAELSAQLELSQAKGRELMEKLKDTHERMLRAAADLENSRKRAAKEKEEIQRFGAERLLKDLLPVVDNIDRALEHAKGSADFDSLKQGVQMTRKLFEDTLGRHGVKSFSAVGQAFDPRLHEAMQQVETAEIAPNQVVNEVLRGYTLNDRLVRPSLVVVSKAPGKAAAPPAAPDAGEPQGEGGGSAPQPPSGS